MAEKPPEDEQPPEETPAPVEIAYKVVEFYQTQTPAELETYLSTLGAQGWRIVQIIGVLGSPQMYGIFTQEPK